MDVNIAVVGGGINGLCIAWEAARRGHSVNLFERGNICGETSRASTKLLHGGLRYLEHGQFGLVFQALRERESWLRDCPQWTQRIAIVIPHFRSSRRPAWLYALGLTLYDWMAKSPRSWRHSALSRQAIRETFPDLRSESLLSGWQFYDGQMDDAALCAWVAARALDGGVVLHTGTEVQGVLTEGGIVLKGGQPTHFDRVVNAAGPWAASLLTSSGVSSLTRLDLIRGSHLLIDYPMEKGLLLEAPGEARVVFALPYQGKMLLGTTEVRHRLGEPIQCSDEEMHYLLNIWHHYFRFPIGENEIIDRFSGVRPIVAGNPNFSRASRESRIERQGCLVTIFGGKWTTARALARRVVDEIER